MDKYIEIDYGYEDIVLRFDPKIYREDAKPLSVEQWDALAAAEGVLYRGSDPGANGYTHIMGNDGDAVMNGIWDICQIAVENSWRADEEQEIPAFWLLRHTAHRVAQAFKLMNYGAESLLR